MAAAGIKICVDLKRKRVFPLFWFFTWERESVCTLFFHEDETHLFLYHAQMGNGCIKFHFKKGERKNRIDLITAVNFFFFLVEISSSICLQKDRETLFFSSFFYRWIELSSVLDTSPNGVVSLAVVAAAALCGLNYSGLGRAERSAFGWCCFDIIPHWRTPHFHVICFPESRRKRIGLIPQRIKLVFLHAYERPANEKEKKRIWWDGR